MAPFRKLLSALIATAGFAISAAALPRQQGFAPLNQQIASAIINNKLRSAIVVDFQSEDGQPSTLGWYLADELSEFWFKKKPKFRVLDRSQLKDAKVLPEDLLSGEMVKRLGSVWGVDAIVAGAVKILSDQYVLTVKVIRVSDNSEVATLSLAIPHSRTLDVLQPMESAASPDVKMYRTGVNGISVPKCLFCPIPAYSDRARAAKVQGSVILSVLISEEGRAIGLRAHSASNRRR